MEQQNNRYWKWTRSGLEVLEVDFCSAASGLEVDQKWIEVLAVEQKWIISTGSRNRKQNSRIIGIGNGLEVDWKNWKLMDWKYWM